MDIRSMIVDLQIYIHLRTGKEVNINPILPQQLFQFKAAHHIAMNWLIGNGVKIIPV